MLLRKARFYLPLEGPNSVIFVTRRRVMAFDSCRTSCVLQLQYRKTRSSARDARTPTSAGISPSALGARWKTRFQNWPVTSRPTSIQCTCNPSCQYSTRLAVFVCLPEASSSRAARHMKTYPAPKLKSCDIKNHHSRD